MAEDTEYKVVMIGDANVGKTSLVNQFYRRTFNINESPTIAASYIQVPIKLKNETIRLNIWDTAGHEKFHCIVPLYARTADALIVIFDITSEQSFENAKNWFYSLCEEIGKSPVSVLCGNKIDLLDEIDTEPFETWAKENNVIFELTSAMTGKNVREMFTRVGEALLNVGLPNDAKQTEYVRIEQPASSCNC
ncbi:small GTP-binding protein [Tritrichomonas foetus]|uniref:Small GTP-binding protein n=1 Tax=Tritrichomonas foetus TaxID=1144522 RepID=A0A1J4K170_9EUKA|nr:small GTP-binding protein [Tritrichomonas foetus]|eukprot:OHT05127.1 small GTP-binding protein [Tritrichomonas foetus]